MLRLFLKYTSVGVINTAIHWLVFTACYLSGINQSASNVVAFIIAVTFSFWFNAKYTFVSRATGSRYMSYLAFMGGMAALVGAIADKVGVNPVITLIIFSATSLLMGFFYSRFIVFRKKE